MSPRHLPTRAWLQSMSLGSPCPAGLRGQEGADSETPCGSQSKVSRASAFPGGQQSKWTVPLGAGAQQSTTLTRGCTTSYQWLGKAISSGAHSIQEASEYMPIISVTVHIFFIKSRPFNPININSWVFLYYNGNNLFYLKNELLFLSPSLT